MEGLALGLIVGLSAGAGFVLLVACVIFFCIRVNRRRAEKRNWSDKSTIVLPIRVNGVDSSSLMSDSSAGQQAATRKQTRGSISSWLRGGKSFNAFSAFSAGITRFSYRELQKATYGFTNLLGQGAFGPVYRAHTKDGLTVAVKVLASDSRQGEREFETEVMLLGRLHHRNLVNLVGYCSERDHRMLVYQFMSNGSLAGHLYNTATEPLNWDTRVRIAQDVARGLEYLHDGAVPPVIHRDIKSANILLDCEMTARVADFGLSKEVQTNVGVSGIRGTYGYVDPQYITTNTFTEKSDVYSFGILLFEIITGRNPQQGLMDYVELARINQDSEGWSELVDVRLDGRCNLEEVEAMANVAYCCLEALPSKRPRMRDVAQSLTAIGRKSLTTTTTAAATATTAATTETTAASKTTTPTRPMTPTRETTAAASTPGRRTARASFGLPAGEWSKPFEAAAAVAAAR